MPGWFVISQSSILGPYLTLTETENARGVLGLSGDAMVVWADDAADAARSRDRLPLRGWSFKSPAEASSPSTTALVSDGFLYVGTHTSGPFSAVPLDVVRRLLDGAGGG
jgi:hypothetical protein